MKRLLCSLKLSRALITGITLVILAFALGGCVSSPPTTTRISKPVTELQRWTAKGKLSLRFQNKSNSAYFTWETNKNDYEIHLFGPLGQGSAYIGRKNSVFYYKEGDTTLTATTPEELMQQRLGWELPVSDMEYWILGLAPPSKTQKNPTLLPVPQYSANGWDVAFTKTTFVKGYTLPAKIIATASSPANNPAPEDQIKLTIIIKDWKLAE